MKLFIKKNTQKQKQQKIHVKNFLKVPKCYGLCDGLVVAIAYRV